MYQLVATCAFGIESLVKYELSQLGYEGTITSPGRIAFQGDGEAICRTNLWLRTADRVLVLIEHFPAPDFESLFETTKSLPWEDWIPVDGEFPVTGKSRKSQLTSVPAVQRAVKRAVVDRLKQGHAAQELPETGPKYRIEIALLDDDASLTIDTTGPSLHKRGYRRFAGSAPLKETLAAALVQLSFWSPGRPLIDPFCGSGTILIEAALIGRNIAPGIARSFTAEQWPTIPKQLWQSARQQATDGAEDALPLRLVGTDADEEILKYARFDAERAGVATDIHFQAQSFVQLTSKREYGCVITNPPYGHRMGDPVQAEGIHRSLPEVLKDLPTWSHFILTAQPEFEKLIQKQADRRRKLYNGRIECTYYQFHGPKPGTAEQVAVQQEQLSVSEVDTDQEPGESKPVRRTQVFGGLNAKAHEQAELFKSRLRKLARHLRRWPMKRDIHCFRLYERDIPEIPLVVDRYEDHLHITEFERPHTRDLGQHVDWLELMAKTAAETLEVDQDQVFLKKKDPQRGTDQHQKVATTGYEIKVREGGLQFYVNLSDYVDTGLFLDHRTTRSMVRDAAKGKRILNLFAYTGAFSVYAADGGAESITTVDWSATYLDWAERNLKLNGFDGSALHFVRDDAREFLKKQSRSEPFEIAIVDPPTFSNSKRSEEVWDIQYDHVELLGLVLQNLVEGGRIYFSTNSRRFKLRENDIPAGSIREISRQTVPEDFRNKRIHRCWLIDK